MLYLDYEQFADGYLVKDVCKCGDNKEHKLVIYDVTNAEVMRDSVRVTSGEIGTEVAECLEGHDYRAFTLPPGGRGNEYSVSFSVRNGELIVIQEHDFDKAVEIIKRLREEDFRNLNVLRLSRFDLDRAIELAIELAM